MEYQDEPTMNTFLSDSKTIIKDMIVCHADETEVHNRMKFVVQSFLLLLDSTKTELENWNELILLILYYKLYSGIFSLSQMNSNFISYNYGFGIPSNFYERGTKKLTAQFFEQCKCVDIQAMLYTIVEKNVYNNHVFSYYLFLYLQSEFQTTNDICDKERAINLIVNYLENCSEKRIKKLQCEKESSYTMQQFLILVSAKIESSCDNIFKIKSWESMKFLLLNCNIYSGVESKINRKRISFYKDGILYVIRGDTYSLSRQNFLNLDDIQNFVREFKKFFPFNCNRDALPASFRENIFNEGLHKIRTSFVTYVENLQQLKSYATGISYDFDDDILLRCLFAHIPFLKQHEGRDMYLNCIPFVFTSLNWLFRFIAYVITIYEFFGTQYSHDKILKNFSGQLGNKIAETIILTPRQMSIYTGCFLTREIKPIIEKGIYYVSTTSAVHNNINQVLQQNKRINFCILDAMIISHQLENQTEQCLQSSVSMNEIDRLLRKNKQYLVEKTSQLVDGHNSNDSGDNDFNQKYYPNTSFLCQSKENSISSSNDFEIGKDYLPSWMNSKNQLGSDEYVSKNTMHVKNGQNNSVSSCIKHENNKQSFPLINYSSSSREGFLSKQINPRSKAMTILDELAESGKFLQHNSQNSHSNSNTAMGNYSCQSKNIARSNAYLNDTVPRNL